MATALLAMVPSFAPAQAEVPSVVTDFTPVTSLVAMVMGDLGAPVQMLDKGADPHDFALRPSQMSAVSEADLIVWIGPEFTPALESAISQNAGAQLALLRAEGTETQAYGDTGDHDHSEAHDGDDHSGADPHAWLDPHNAGHWLGLIAAELSRLDPENAAVYADNAAQSSATLEVMEADLSALLTPLQDRPYVAFHDAYGYFNGHFGLNFAGALSLGDASTPGAARVAELRDRIAADKIQCVFPETGHDPALLEQIIEGTGARLGTPLDPEGLMLDPGPGAYEALMRGMAGSLAACLTP